MKRQQKTWSKKEIDFLIVNHENVSFKNIAKKLGRTYSSVKNKSQKLGLIRDRKYQYDFNFFKKPLKEESAYWLGFIYADGWVSGKEIGIELKSTDFKHLKKFNISLNGNIPVTFREKEERYIKGKLARKSKLCKIRLYNVSMIYDLNALGVFSNKSLCAKFPIFDDEKIQWHFLRGHFDGDGSISYDKRSNQLRVKIDSGSNEFKKEYANFLKKYGIKTFFSGETVCGITGKDSTKNFLLNIYNNATIYLDRKYEKYKTYKYLFGFNK